MKSLHNDFLSSAPAFNKANRYWWDMLDSCAMDFGVTSSWKKWFSNKIDPNPVTDVVPVFSAINRKEARGIAVNMARDPQWGPILAYTDIFGLHTDQPVCFLTISCFLTEKTSSISKQLFTRWIIPGTTSEQMESHIEKLLAKKKK